MKIATVCFLIRGEEVCLALKKRKFGVEKLNGYGGEFKQGETDRDCAKRETEEESGVVVDEKNLVKKAIVRTYLASVPQYELHVFTVCRWSGEPQESKEMGEPQWFPIECLPFESMLPDDPFWVKRALKGGAFVADIYLSEDGKNVEDHKFYEAVFT